MKKTTITLLSCALAVCTAAYRFDNGADKAYAISEYLRVIEKDVPFYSDAYGRNFVLCLPYTYYVKYLDDVGSLTHVEILTTGGAIDGYVDKSALYEDGLYVATPYVNVSLVTANVCMLYSDAELTVPLQYVFADREATYYGYVKTPVGTKAYCVGYGDKLGYIKESDVIPFSIADHPNELTFITPTETPEPPVDDTAPNDNPDDLSLKLIIVLCLVLAGVIGLFVAFKKKTVKKTSFYDENDFE